MDSKPPNFTSYAKISEGIKDISLEVDIISKTQSPHPPQLLSVNEKKQLKHSPHSQLAFIAPIKRLLQDSLVLQTSDINFKAEIIWACKSKLCGYHWC